MAEIEIGNIKKHHDRQDLTGEHKLGDIGQLIFLLLFLAAWICDSFVFKYSIFLSEYIPLFIRIIASSIILILSGFLARSGLKIVFGETREEPTVIKNGIFSKIRHPIYTGSILFYLGFIILTFSIISFIVWIVIIAFYYYISKFEEKLLLKAFGSDYEQYMKEVPMLFPKLFQGK